MNTRAPDGANNDITWKHSYDTDEDDDDDDDVDMFDG